MSEIVDLDVFVGEPRQVKLGGQVYLFPRDIPAEVYLEVLRLQQGAGDLEDSAVVERLRDDLLELLQVHQPNLAKLPAAFSLPVLVRAIGAIYRAADEAEEAEDVAADPTPAGSPGTKSRSRKPRSVSPKS